MDIFKGELNSNVQIQLNFYTAIYYIQIVSQNETMLFDDDAMIIIPIELLKTSKLLDSNDNKE